MSNRHQRSDNRVMLRMHLMNLMILKSPAAKTQQKRCRFRDPAQATERVHGLLACSERHRSAHREARPAQCGRQPADLQENALKGSMLGAASVAQIIANKMRSKQEYVVH